MGVTNVLKSKLWLLEAEGCDWLELGGVLIVDAGIK